MLAAADAQPKSKQMTEPSIAGVPAKCTPYNRQSKHWREITDGVALWKRRALSSWSNREKYQVGNIFNFSFNM